MELRPLNHRNVTRGKNSSHLLLLQAISSGERIQTKPKIGIDDRKSSSPDIPKIRQLNRPSSARVLASIEADDVMRRALSADNSPYSRQKSVNERQGTSKNVEASIRPGASKCIQERRRPPNNANFAIERQSKTSKNVKTASKNVYTIK